MKACFQIAECSFASAKIRDNKKIRHLFYIIPHFFLRNQNILLKKQIAKRFYLSLLERLLTLWTSIEVPSLSISRRCRKIISSAEKARKIRQMGCHIIILTDKYYVEANTEILFTLHQTLRNTDKQGGWRGWRVCSSSSPTLHHSSPVYFSKNPTEKRRLQLDKHHKR